MNADEYAAKRTSKDAKKIHKEVPMNEYQNLSFTCYANYHMNDLTISSLVVVIQLSNHLLKCSQIIALVFQKWQKILNSEITFKIYINCPVTVVIDYSKW